MASAARYVPCLLPVLSLFASTAGARIVSVSPGGNIQAAINTAAAGDEIVLQPGTYSGVGNCDIDFLGKAVTVRGSNPDDPAVVAATIIDGSYGSADHTGFWFYNGEGPDSVVVGLTIRGCSSSRADILKVGASHGDPDSTFKANGGGGIACLYSSPTIRQCVFRCGPSVIFLHKSAGPRISHCRIQWAQDHYYGGAAIVAYHSQAIIDNCIITDCSTITGSALYAYNSQPRILRGRVDIGADEFSPVGDMDLERRSSAGGHRSARSSALGESEGGVGGRSVASAVPVRCGALSACCRASLFIRWIPR